MQPVKLYISCTEYETFQSPLHAVVYAEYMEMKNYCVLTKNGDVYKLLLSNRIDHVSEPDAMRAIHNILADEDEYRIE